MRYKLAKFFQGRNGSDSLSKTLLWTGVILYLFSMAVMGFWGETAGTIICAASLVLVFMSLWRALSRNIAKRQDEDRRFRAFWSGLKTGVNNRKTRFPQRKEYKFFKCPDCRSILRVPRGKGKIQITCRKCGARFTGKT